MLIKFDAPEDLADHLKALTKSAVGSKAFLLAAQQYAPLLKQVAQLQQQINDLQSQRETQEEVIQGAQESARALLDYLTPKQPKKKKGRA